MSKHHDHREITESGAQIIGVGIALFLFVVVLVVIWIFA
jgi:hypothetical protein